jgi:membrane protein insertase Oxa1/YidC/SpoIIIJ
MFTTLIVQPIFNLLVLVYALLPGHNFGLALIIFTVIIRILLWPVLKKQLHDALPILRAVAKLELDAAPGTQHQ